MHNIYLLIWSQTLVNWVWQTVVYVYFVMNVVNIKLNAVLQQYGVHYGKVFVIAAVVKDFKFDSFHKVICVLHDSSSLEVYYYMWPWSTKAVTSSTGIFVAIANNTSWVKIFAFYFTTKHH